MQQDSKNSKTSLLALSIAALGIAYGDIGTSPLYALRESLGILTIDPTNVLGILSLIFWSLIFVVSLKYLVVVFRANNQGEGGVLALLASLKDTSEKTYRWFFVLGIFAAGLIMGDGMLTPAISIVSSVEGLAFYYPKTQSFVLPIAYTLVIGFFWLQSYEIKIFKNIFGILILLWFLILGALGIYGIVHNPSVIQALNPQYAIVFFKVNGIKGYVLLGGVFLVVTGAEALYTELGKFGKTPIRLSWSLVALPALALNYFGQGAYLLAHPEAIINPFYALAPTWIAPLLLIAAIIAALIASQAIITAVFSLIRQAILLGLFPHVPMTKISYSKNDEVYIPQINFILMAGVLGFIFIFKHSSALTHAYGVAINLVMVLTTFMVTYAARQVWQWNSLKIFAIFSVFIGIDLLFLGANVQKIPTGGYIPITFAVLCAFIMFTWSKGMSYLRRSYYMQKDDLENFINSFQDSSLNYLKGITAIFLTDSYDKSGGALLHFFKLNHALPENILILDHIIENVPYVPSAKHFEFYPLTKNIFHLTLHYGFMEFINIPQALRSFNYEKKIPFEIDINKITYLVEIPYVFASKEKKTLLFYWQEKLFAFMARNYSSNIHIDFYKLPYNRTIAIGTYCEI